MAGKGTKAVNAAWGVATRAGLSSLESRLYIMNVLGKSGAMYGTEIWGLAEREQMERVQGRVVKMGMGVSKITPGYIWRAESGRKALLVETRRRVLAFLGTVSRLKRERLVRICLQEELRALGNFNPSYWGKDLGSALDDWEGRDFLEILRKGEMDKKEFQEKLKEALERGEAKEMAEDDRKIRNSTFNPTYKHLGRPDKEKSYWGMKEISWGDKMMWARMRCGNVGRAGNKGYRDVSCRLCGGEREDLEHILQCDGVKEGTLKELWESWEGTGRDESTVELLRGGPIPELCKVVRGWEKLMRRTEVEQGSQ